MSSVPAMIVLGIRHALEVDHITAIDNLVRLHNATKRAGFVGTGFSLGHMVSVLLEMILIIYVIGGITGANSLAFWGGIIGAVAIATIGGVNIYAMRKWRKTGAGIIATRMLSRTGMLGPFGSSFVTGMIFGLGFDTATQIAAITLSAAASATMGIQVALGLAGFFALGMIPLDSLDSRLLQSALSKILSTRGFRYLSYSLSAIALCVSAAISYSMLSNSSPVPVWLGPTLAAGMVGTAFGYGFFRSRRSQAGVIAAKSSSGNN